MGFLLVGMIIGGWKIGRMINTRLRFSHLKKPIKSQTLGTGKWGWDSGGLDGSLLFSASLFYLYFLSDCILHDFKSRTGLISHGFGSIID